MPFDFMQFVATSAIRTDSLRPQSRTSETDDRGVRASPDLARIVTIIGSAEIGRSDDRIAHIRDGRNI